MNVNAICPTCGLPQAEHRGLGCIPLLMDHIKNLEDLVERFSKGWNPGLERTILANQDRPLRAMPIEISRSNSIGYHIYHQDLHDAFLMTGRRLTDPERQQRELKRV